MMDCVDYAEVVEDVRSETLARVDAVVAFGVDRRQLVLDPGLGFAKTAAHNWSLLANLERFSDIGLPVLVGASRKSFLGTLLADHSGPRPLNGREDATTALTMFAALHGVWGVRVHSVRPSVDAVRVAAALRGVGSQVHERG
jgi:dihydropteroate synthase